MPNLIAIGGQPAVGKTTLVKRFFTEYDPWKSFKYKKLYGHFNEELNLIILGKYTKSEMFSGTDKLSMAVQPDFEEFLDLRDLEYNVLFEGDRLFNLKALKKAKELMDIPFAKTLDLHVFVVESVHTKERHIDRNDSQSEKFIKGRVTKVNNIKNWLHDDYTILINNEEEDIEKNFNILLDTIRKDNNV
jgi:GTPase SAR1 family protein|tara:strand:- start:37 stop:603 length:567 start_codon:yes stop_codon:yes gene_type:complete